MNTATATPTSDTDLSEDDGTAQLRALVGSILSAPV